MNNHIDLSIIIPTFGRKIELDNLLESISKMTLLNYTIEIIIVDQNPINYLDKTLCKYKSSLSSNFYHYNVNFVGLSKAKNFGFSKSNGRFITYPDDDCMVFSDSYQRALDFIKDKKIDIISGKCIDKNGKDSVAKFSKNDFFLTNKSISGGYVEAAAIIKRKVLEEYKFDENLGVGSFFGAHEGFDWLYRILNKGTLTIYYSPEILFYHPQVLSKKGDFSSFKRINSYSYGFVYSRFKNGLYMDIYLRIFLVLGLSFVFSVFNFRKCKYYFVELFSLILGIFFYNTYEK